MSLHLTSGGVAMNSLEWHWVKANQTQPGRSNCEMWADEFLHGHNVWLPGVKPPPRIAQPTTLELPWLRHPVSTISPQTTARHTGMPTPSLHETTEGNLTRCVLAPDSFSCSGIRCGAHGGWRLGVGWHPAPHRLPCPRERRCHLSRSACYSAVMGVQRTLMTYCFRQGMGNVGFIYKFLLKLKTNVLPKSKTRYRITYYLHRTVRINPGGKSWPHPSITLHLKLIGPIETIPLSPPLSSRELCYSW